MLIKAIKIFAINIVFLTTIQIAISNEIILPKKKPKLSKELIEKKIIKGTLIPLIKPTIKKTETIGKKIKD